MLAKIKRIGALLLLVAVSVAVCLTLLEFAFRLQGPEDAPAREVYYRSFWAWDQQAFALLDSPLQGFHISHPLFGHTGNPVIGRNNYGFLSEVSYPIRRKSKKDIVVGLLGGSVAMDTAKHVFAKMNAAPELESLTRCGYRFLPMNLAEGAMKQPQQLAIFLHFLEEIDLSINLDGHNDAVLDPGDGFPVEFPVLTNLLYYRTPKKMDVLRQMFRARSIQAMLVRVTMSYPWVAHSALYYRIFRALHPMLERRYRLLERRIGNLNPKVLPLVGESLRSEALVHAWTKYTRMQQLVAEANGKLAFFFVQPSQYVAGSKSFTEKELDVAFTKEEKQRAKIVNAHKELRTAAHELSKAGLPVYDLANAFSGESGQIYIDDCCHVNFRGREILAEEIVRRIAPALKKKWSCDRSGRQTR